MWSDYAMTATLQRWSPAEFNAHVDEVLAVYGAAMGYSPAMVRLRREQFIANAQRNDFRAVVIIHNRDLVGFGYGYRSAPGQWWHDSVRPGLTAQSYLYWLTDCFELSELHVNPASQGLGFGSQLLSTLLTEIPCRTVVLSTPEASNEDSRAWHLYRRFQFVDVLRHYYFSGDGRTFAVLGRETLYKNAQVT
jgi:ribosomal protein S18 acetylase RimI-like enzyme